MALRGINLTLLRYTFVRNFLSYVQIEKNIKLDNFYNNYRKIFYKLKTKLNFINLKVPSTHFYVNKT